MTLSRKTERIITKIDLQLKENLEVLADLKKLEKDPPAKGNQGG